MQTYNGLAQIWWLRPAVMWAMLTLKKPCLKKICFLADCRMRWVLCFSLTLGLRVSLRDGDPRLQHRMRRGLRLKFLGWSSAAASFMITTAPLKGAQTVPGQTHEFPTCCTRPLAKTEPLWESFLTTSRCFYLLHCILLSWKVACWRLGKTMETRLWGTCCPGIPTLRSLRLKGKDNTWAPLFLYFEGLHERHFLFSSDPQ